MAGNENQDWTDAVRVTKEPTETSYSSLPGQEHGPSSTDNQSGVAEGRANMALSDNNDYVPGAVGGCNEKAQQVALDKSNRKEPKTSGGRRPNVDQELCEKKVLKIGTINHNIYRRVCDLLNIEQVLGGDWQTLAGRLGYDVTAVKIFKRKDNPAETMLNDWDSHKHNYLEHVVKELRGMSREDIADLLQEVIDKKGDTCNCPKCGHIV